MKRYLVQLLGGYTDKEQFLASLTEEDRHEVLNEAVKKLFNTIDEHDIFRLDERGVVTFEGKPQTPEQVNLLRQEAHGLLGSKLFRVIDKEMKYQTNIRLRLKSQTDLDITAAKCIEWTWDVVKNRLKTI